MNESLIYCDVNSFNIAKKSMAVSIIKFKDLIRCSLKEIRMQLKLKAFNIRYACFLVFVKVDTIEQFKINLE